jgi:hypothetical protein
MYPGVSLEFDGVTLPQVVLDGLSIACSISPRCLGFYMLYIRCESVIRVFILCLIMQVWSIIQLNLRIQPLHVQSISQSCFECGFERLWKIVPKLRPQILYVVPKFSKKIQGVKVMQLKSLGHRFQCHFTHNRNIIFSKYPARFMRIGRFVREIWFWKAVVCIERHAVFRLLGNGASKLGEVLFIAFGSFRVLAS